jgi:hypothetical protein
LQQVNWDTTVAACHYTMSASAPKPYPRLVLAPHSVPTGGATAAAATTDAAFAAAPATRAFGAAKLRELVKGVDVKAQKRTLDQRTQKLPRTNNAQQEEEQAFKGLESLLASAIATAASEDALVRVCACVRACVRVCVHMLCCPCECTIALRRPRRVGAVGENDGGNFGGGSVRTKMLSDMAGCVCVRARACVCAFA